MLNLVNRTESLQISSRFPKTEKLGKLFEKGKERENYSQTSIHPHQAQSQAQSAIQSQSQTQQNPAERPPAIPKVVTVTNTLALVVELQENEFSIYIFHLKMHKTFPVRYKENFPKFELGSWVIVGLYQSQKLASICPEPLVTMPHLTQVINGHVMVLTSVSEGLHTASDVNCKEAFLSTIANKSDPKTLLRMKWIGAEKSKETSHKKYWEVTEVEKREIAYVHDFPEELYRECSEFVRKRRQNSSQTDKHQDELKNSAARHFGLIAEINEEKKTIGVWSVGLTSEECHTAKWPMEYHKILQKELPDTSLAIGQWIRFDTATDYACQLMNRNSRGNNRLSISEFLSCSTPSGIAVSQFGKNLKMLLSCTFVRSTSHPLVFDIQDFGYVMAPKNSLISGANMQLIIEKVAYQYRKSYGFSWRVIASEFVKKSKDEKEKCEPQQMHQSISATSIKERDRFECATLIHTETRVNNYHNNRQSLNSHNSHLSHNNQQGRRNDNNYMRDSTNTYENTYNPKKRLIPFQGPMNVVAMVEKIDFERKCGILWVFSPTSQEVKASKQHPNGSSPTREKSLHFMYTNENPKISIGDSIYATLVHKPCEPLRGTPRWILQSFTTKIATYTFGITNNRLNVQDYVSSHMSQDNLGRLILHGTYFDNIVDESGQAQHYRVQSNMPYKLPVTVTRRKIRNAMFPRQGENLATNANGAPMVIPETIFAWVLVCIHHQEPVVRQLFWHPMSSDGYICSQEERGPSTPIPPLIPSLSPLKQRRPSAEDKP